MTVKVRPGEILRAIAAVLRSYRLYPEGHPIREEKIDELLLLSREVASAGKGESSIDLIIHEDSFFHENKLLSKESITFQWMMREWQERGVESVTIMPVVIREDVVALVDFLAGLGPAPTAGTRVNAAMLLSPEEMPKAVTAIRTMYADAIDITREIGAGLEKGVAPPVGAARQTVEKLVDGVLSDPDSALLLATMHTHDEYTFFHMVNVCILGVATGAAIGLSKEQLTILGVGGLLHDIGKIGIPAELLNRSGTLTEEDWVQIRRHPLEGAATLLRSWNRISPLAAKVAFEHHIRIDGAGYPAGPIEGHRTDLLSRIIAVVDTFDAMTSRRPYRRAEQRQRALDVLLSGAGSHYDDRIVKVFVKVLGFYPPGSVVQLDDRSVAIVVRNNPDTLSRPVVKRVKDAGGEPIESDEIDLSQPGAQEIGIVLGLDQSAAGVDPADLLD